MRIALSIIALIAGTTATAADVSPVEVRGFVDLRGVAVDSSLPSFVHGGLGLRCGAFDVGAA